MRRLAVAAARDTGRGFVMEPEDMEGFIGGSGRRSEKTTANYRGALRQLYERLPEGKLLTRDALERWRDEITERYSTSTVNTMITAVNGFLGYMDHRELQFPKRLAPEEGRLQELTRDEYLRLLNGAKAMEDRRGYMLVKTFVNTGIGVRELESVTVEAARAGRFTVESHGVRRGVRVPEILRTDLLEYAREEGVVSGPVFRGADGGALCRSAAAEYLKALAGPARVAEEKCNARALRRLYQKTRAEAEDGVEELVERMMERQVEEEQVTIGWDA